MNLLWRQRISTVNKRSVLKQGDGDFIQKSSGNIPYPDTAIFPKFARGGYGAITGSPMPLSGIKTCADMIYQFYIELLESYPLVWRRIVVPADYTFDELHKAIQGAFGWENSHLFQFSESGFSDQTSYGFPGDDVDPDRVTMDARKTRVSRILKKEGQTYCYIYDFGDNWEHRLTLEKIVADDTAAPFCLDGAGACPPEDVGGTAGYQEMLAILKNPRHPERAGYIKWLGLVPGEKWDAKFCSIREVNKRLALLGR
jgi:hypothetical protein